MLRKTQKYKGIAQDMSKISELVGQCWCFVWKIDIHRKNHLPRMQIYFHTTLKFWPKTTKYSIFSSISLALLEEFFVKVACYQWQKWDSLALKAECHTANLIIQVEDLGYFNSQYYQPATRRVFSFWLWGSLPLYMYRVGRHSQLPVTSIVPRLQHRGGFRGVSGHMQPPPSKRT